MPTGGTVDLTLGKNRKFVLFLLHPHRSPHHPQHPHHSHDDQTSGEDCGGSMEYNWLTSHDPITIDANLAEIDFDDFKNEDIQNAYAFSLQSYVSILM